MLVEVKNIYTKDVQFRAEVKCAENESYGVKLGLAVKWAIENGVSLANANLRRAIFEGAGLCRANFAGADLNSAFFVGAKLIDANFSNASLHDVNFTDAELRRANFSGAGLERASFKEARLRRAVFIGSSLIDADFDGADLEGVVFNYARLDGVENLNPSPFMVCPEEGAFIGWKKLSGGYVAKLEIPARAKRTGTLTSRKCRASLVKTLAIYDRKGNEVKGRVMSKLFPSAYYQKGRLTKADGYDSDFSVECTHGIHFFITRQEAEAWLYG